MDLLLDTQSMYSICKFKHPNDSVIIDFEINFVKEAVMKVTALDNYNTFDL